MADSPLRPWWRCPNLVVAWVIHEGLPFSEKNEILSLTYLLANPQHGIYSVYNQEETRERRAFNMIAPKYRGKGICEPFKNKKTT